MEPTVANGHPTEGRHMAKEREGEDVQNITDVIMRHVESKAADLGGRIERHAARIDKRDVDVEARLRHLEEFKARAYGAMAIAAAVFGLIGTLIGKFLTR